jgi:hypothetical protein
MHSATYHHGNIAIWFERTLSNGILNMRFALSPSFTVISMGFVLYRSDGPHAWHRRFPLFFHPHVQTHLSCTLIIFTSDSPDFSSIA